MTDLPDSGPFTSLLIGAWWPAEPGQPTAAVAHWSQISAAKQQEAQELDNLITLLGSHSSGRTAEDMLARLRLGKKRLLDIAHQCRAKSEANASVAGAVNHLRDRLKVIADDGNQKIDQILNRQGPLEAKLPDVNAIIAQANSNAAEEGATALSAITDATQRVFDGTGVGNKAREWLNNNGANFDAPPPHRPRSAHEVIRAKSGDGGTSGISGRAGVSSNAGFGCGGAFGAPADDAFGGSGGGLAGASPLTSAIPSFGDVAAPLPGLPGAAVGQAVPSGMPSDPPDPDDPASPWPRGATDSPDMVQVSAAQISPSPASTPMAGGALDNLCHPAGSSPSRATPAVPSGPLPGYGADLRPTGAATPGAPASPAGLAPAASPSSPGGTTTAASGGTTVASAGDRAAAGKAIIGADTPARRPAERGDLQRTVDAVARQAPNLAWAAGLREDDTTIVLVTDLAGGWTPPGIRLPPGVSLLAPAQRRRALRVLDLLGPVIAVATHQPGGYVADAGPGDPVPGAGERARYGHRVDELRPTLVGAVGVTARRPRIVQTVARAVARRSGVADNEAELFRAVIATTENKVLSAYPRHAAVDVADWMLLAAIDALIDGSEELAHYHLAWHRAVAP